MANASSKKFGPGQQDQGKGDGSGGMAPTTDQLPDNEILSNRDTSRHSRERGLDSRHVQNEQRHEHVANHDPGDGEAGEASAREKLADERPDPDQRVSNMDDDAEGDGTAGDGNKG